MKNKRQQPLTMTTANIGRNENMLASLGDGMRVDIHIQQQGPSFNRSKLPQIQGATATTIAATAVIAINAENYFNWILVF